MLLRAAAGTAAPQATTPALGAADLVGAALEAFAVDPELLAAERARVRVLLIDDAQQLDPQAARLVRVLAAGTDVTLVAGDPNQAVFGFRGGEASGLLADDSPSVTLSVSHRCAPAVARTVSGIARRLPGGSGGRHIDGSGAEDGSVPGRLGAPAHAGAAMIADALRRAHLVHRGSGSPDGGLLPAVPPGRAPCAPPVARRRGPAGTGAPGASAGCGRGGRAAPPAPRPPGTSRR